MRDLEAAARSPGMTTVREVQQQQALATLATPSLLAVSQPVLPDGAQLLAHSHPFSPPPFFPPSPPPPSPTHTHTHTVLQPLSKDPPWSHQFHLCKAVGMMIA